MPFAADAIAAQQVQENLTALYKCIHDIEKKRLQNEQDISNIAKLQTADPNSSDYQNKLRSLLKSALSLGKQEEDLQREALQIIADIRNINYERRLQARHAGNKELIRRGTLFKMLVSSAQTLPLFVGRIDEKPPPLCGAVSADSGYVAKIGDMVAVSVKIPDGDEKNWILAEVVSYNYGTNKYEVDDILAEQNQKSRHTLSKRGVVPLPLMRANPETDPTALFAQDTAVMALYPTTSCFYEGIVNKPPATHTDEYEISFEDKNYTGNYSPPLQVAQRYVIASKQKVKQT